MNNTIEAAKSYFDNLWAEARRSWMTEAVTPAPMKDGRSVPIDFCLSTVARLSAQQKAPVGNVESLVGLMRRVAETQFFYPAESRHITLLGCTQRASSKEDFPDERRQKIFEICNRVISGRPVAKMFIKGVGIVGNQVFLQVFPNDNEWAHLRFELAEAVKGIGEHPITYPNMGPIHLNIMRITDSDPEKLLALLDVIEQRRESEVGELEISTIDYILTDFVLSDARERLGTIQLTSR